MNGFSKTLKVLPALALAVATAALVIGVGPASAATTITVNTHQCQKKDATTGALGTFTSGNTTTYKELDYVTCQFTLSASAAASGSFQIVFTGNNGKCTFFNQYFSLLSSAPATDADRAGKRTTSVTTGNISVTTSGSVQQLNDPQHAGQFDWAQTLNVNATAADAGEVFYYELQFSNEAHACQGSSTHTTIAGSDTVGSGGAQEVPFPANQFISLAVTTSSLHAQYHGRFVTVRWQTASEQNVLGFNVYRKTHGKLVRLNRRLVPAGSLSGTSTSHRYSFRAAVASRKLAAGSRYVLAEVHANGSRTMYGPVRASAAS